MSPFLLLVPAAFVLFRNKKQPRSRAIVVVQGTSTSEVVLEIGERLSIQFLEEVGEEWKMIDAPDGFLLGSAKLKWAPSPGGRRLKSFDFESKRPGTTKAEFVKSIGSDVVDNKVIKIFIED